MVNLYFFNLIKGNYSEDSETTSNTIYNVWLWGLTKIATYRIAQKEHKWRTNTMQ